MRTTDALRIGMELGRIRGALDAWEENKHPRADNGQFTSGSGGGGGSKASSKSGVTEHKVTKKPDGKNSAFTHGTLKIGGKDIKYQVKAFETGSRFGIEGGSISKLFAQGADGQSLFEYDRGWIKKPRTKEAKQALEYLKKQYNEREKKEAEAKSSNNNKAQEFLDGINGTKIKNPSQFLKSKAKEGVDDIVVRTTYMDGGWYDIESAAYSAGYGVYRFTHPALKNEHQFAECYRFYKK